MRKKRVVLEKRTFWIRFRTLFSRWKRKHRRKRYPNLEEIYEEDPSFQKLKVKGKKFITFDELQEGLNKRAVKRKVVSRKRVVKKKPVTKRKKKTVQKRRTREVTKKRVSKKKKRKK